MKVKDLKEKLKNLPEDLEVILASDAEGNEFIPLADLEEVRYEAENNYYGYVVDEEDWDEEIDGQFKTNAVALWPMG